jgi:hypothetical protein
MGTTLRHGSVDPEPIYTTPMEKSMRKQTPYVSPAIAISQTNFLVLISTSGYLDGHQGTSLDVMQTGNHIS